MRCHAYICVDLLLLWRHYWSFFLPDYTAIYSHTKVCSCQKIALLFVFSILVSVSIKCLVPAAFFVSCTYIFCVICWNGILYNCNIFKSRWKQAWSLYFPVFQRVFCLKNIFLFFLHLLLTACLFWPVNGQILYFGIFLHHSGYDFRFGTCFTGRQIHFGVFITLCPGIVAAGEAPSGSFYTLLDQSLFIRFLEYFKAF